MSRDPERLLEPGGDATDAERDLLRSADDVEPAPDARGALWAALATRLPPIGGTGAPPGPSGGAGTGGAGAAAGAGSILGAKALGVALVGGVLVIGAWSMLRSPPPASSPDAPPVPASSMAMPAPASETPSAVRAAEILAPEPPVAAPPATAAVSTGSGRPHLPQHGPSASTAAPSGSVTSAVDALREESALVAAARVAMRRGDGAAALDSLEIARVRFPRGTLLQEREVLTIEALAQSGNAPAASRRASSFLKAFPASPHVAHVRTFVQ